MTSKSLFFRLMREDLKRKLWAVGLSFLTFFFAMPVTAALGITNLMQQYERWTANPANYQFGDGITIQMEFSRRMKDLVIEIIGLDNFAMGIIMGTAALVLALTGFMYLHSKKQVDFYHSIPVRREVIFCVKYLDGILIILLTYGINLLFALGIFMMNGANVAGMVSGSLEALAVHMTGFLLIYGLMTIAVILTGNFFVSILGGLVLFSYVPAILALLEGLMYLFFATMNGRFITMAEWMVKGSPMSYYVSLVGEGMDLPMIRYGELAGRIGAALAVALLMALIAMVLYKFRPSESAGKAMAFKVSMTPIKILLVVPITILVTLLFWNIYYSMPWAVFGFVFGLVITYGIIEIIYHFDFRKFFAEPLHMGISAVLSLVIIGIFQFDLIGYDSYLPEEDQFRSASVYAGSLQDWNDYGLPYQQENEEETGQYRWRYMDSSDYVAGNMEITDYALISQLAKEGIANASESKADRGTARYGLSQEEDGSYWTQLEMGYHLKNGKKVYRQYRVSVTALRDTFDAMYESEEYKKGIYPVLSFEAENVTGIYEAKDYTITKVEADESQKKKILAAYKEELTALTLKERSETVPVTSLRFLTIAENTYLNAITSSRLAGYSGDFRMEDMNQVNFFPVYPSFTRTIELLKEAGVDLPFTVSAEDVDRIMISSEYYEEDYSDSAADRASGQGEMAGEASEQVTVEAEAVYTEYYDKERGTSEIIIKNDGTPEFEEKLNAVLEAGTLRDMMDMNGLQPREQAVSVYVYRDVAENGGSTSEEKVSEFCFMPDQLPEFIKTAIRYDKVLEKRVSYGIEGQN